MKVAIYNQYWQTLGGGEKYAGGIAQVLSEDHEVTLLAHQPVDLGQFSERLALDLSRVQVEVLSEALEAVTEASEQYDILVNASFLSSSPNRAAHGIYIVYFPTVASVGLPAWRTAVGRVGRALLPSPQRARLAWGVHPGEARRRHLMRWSSGRTRIVVDATGSEPVPVRVTLGRYLTPGQGALRVELRHGEDVLGSSTITPVRGRFDRRRVTVLEAMVPPDPSGQPIALDLVSPTHRPNELLGGRDDRQLGAPVLGVTAGGGARAWLRSHLPALSFDDEPLDYLDTYDRILGVAGYSSRWVERLWERPAGVLYPPVTRYPAGTKDQSIVSVGRFFARGAGHSKKQLEMVHAFRQLVEGGVEGWTLHLVGGCAPEHRGYLDEIHRAAEGLDVRIHVDASGAAVADLYSRASIYWHAAGLGEDEERHPERLEHFGITTVEAMSAGAVPVVYAGGGQLEVVEDGRNGFHFRTPTQLVERTRQLIDDPGRRREMSGAASDRAEDFTFEAFAANLRREVAALTDGSQPPR